MLKFAQNYREDHGTTPMLDFILDNMLVINPEKRQPARVCWEKATALATELCDDRCRDSRLPLMNSPAESPGDSTLASLTTHRSDMSSDLLGHDVRSLISSLEDEASDFIDAFMDSTSTQAYAQGNPPVVTSEVLEGSVSARSKKRRDFTTRTEDAAEAEAGKSSSKRSRIGK
jgi:hypothetical protein